MYVYTRTCTHIHVPQLQTTALHWEGLPLPVFAAPPEEGLRLLSVDSHCEMGTPFLTLVGNPPAMDEWIVCVYVCVCVWCVCA